MSTVTILQWGPQCKLHHTALELAWYCYCFPCTHQATIRAREISIHAQHQYICLLHWCWGHVDTTQTEVSTGHAGSSYQYFNYFTINLFRWKYKIIILLPNCVCTACFNFRHIAVS